MPSMRRDLKKKRIAGLTLLEVMISMALLSAGLLAMLTMQIQASRSGRTGRHVTEAARIAQDQMELLHRLPWAAIPAGAWTPNVQVQGVSTQTTQGPFVAQAFNVQFRIQAVAGDTNLRQLDVRVTWTEPNQGAGATPRRYAMSSIRHNDP